MPLLLVQSQFLPTHHQIGFQQEQPINIVDFKLIFKTQRNLTHSNEVLKYWFPLWTKLVGKSIGNRQSTGGHVDQIWSSEISLLAVIERPRQNKHSDFCVSLAIVRPATANLWKSFALLFTFSPCHNSKSIITILSLKNVHRQSGGQQGGALSI